MNLEIVKLMDKIPANAIAEAFGRRRDRGRKLFLAASKSGLGLALAGAAATAASTPRMLGQWFSSAGPEARFMLIRKLAADEKMMRRLRESLEESGPAGFRGKHLLLRGANWLPAAGVGAGLMYLLDPQWGSARRARIAEKFGHAVKNMDSTRVVTAVAGGALTVSGLRLGNPAGYAGSALGVGLLARGVGNLRVERLVGLGRKDGLIDMHKTIMVDAPVSEVFSHWRQFHNFPQFMSHVKEVQDLGGGRSHWVVEGPAGVRAEWDAEMTMLEPDKALEWRSLPGSPVESVGLVRFKAIGPHQTRVEVRLSYSPPAGALGHAAASLFGDNPRQMMDEDLQRFKSMVERGQAQG